MFEVYSGKLVKISDRLLGHWCPACAIVHPISIWHKNVKGEIWDWNGDPYLPHFYAPFRPTMDCNYDIINGQINYHHSCNHEYADQVVDLTLPPA